MDTIVIGAGAAGLIAAKLLAEKGQKVTVLEARHRIGGRINTFEQNEKEGLEGGAEFIHGKLESTFALLREARLEYEQVQGEFWQVSNGRWAKNESFISQEDLLVSRLKDLKEDLSITEFLQKEFGGEEYAEMRRSLSSYIEGYYAGEPSRTSSMAFLYEWLHEDEQQYRPKGGYRKLLGFLENEIKKNGSTVELSSVVKTIEWQKGQVNVTTDLNKTYSAKKIIVTVPIGIWLEEEDARAAIKFIPELPEKRAAAAMTGFGSALKILLEFKDCFWEKEDLIKQPGVDIKDLGFLFSDFFVPTWWTQLPVRTPILTGWLAGPKAWSLKDTSDEVILDTGIESLSRIFNMPVSDVTGKLVNASIFNWASDPFTRGGYCYSTTETREALKVLLLPVEETLFFAGDGFYNGPEMGTVESALVSGKRAAMEAGTNF